jgi:hypothetical protein
MVPRAGISRLFLSSIISLIVSLCASDDHICVPEETALTPNCLLQQSKGAWKGSLDVADAAQPGKSRDITNEAEEVSRPNRTSIHYDGEIEDLSNPRLALYTTLVRPFGQQHWNKKHNDMLLDTFFLYCSARWAGSGLPFHITVSGIEQGGLELLEDLGYHVHDLSVLEDIVKHKWYKPIFSKKEAADQGRLWIDPISVARYGVDAEHALDRKDGWATYFKFFAWNNTQLDIVLHTDVDVQFLGNPDGFIHDAAKHGEVFIATAETGGRQYPGLNTHMMFMRPSRTVFEDLVQKATTGDYAPLTNTEQDVLEWYFDVKDATHRNMWDVPHAHNDETPAAWKEWLISEAPSQCSSAALINTTGKDPFTCRSLEEACGIDKSERSRHMVMQPPQQRSCPSRTPPNPSRRPRVFVLVPGFGGESERQEQLLENVAWLRRQDADITCMIYVYKSAEELTLDEQIFAPCSVERQKGYPAEFMLQPPENLWQDSDYVLIWFDDVALHPDSKLSRFIDVLNFNGLGLLTPSFSEKMLSEYWPERHGRIMYHNSSKSFAIGRYTSYAELLFSFMTPASFQCLRGLIDIDVNPYGYGLDRLFPDRCSEHCLGILDETTMYDTSHGTFSYDDAEKYQDAYFTKHGFPTDSSLVFGPLSEPIS